jgi:hypothetical protein
MLVEKNEDNRNLKDLWAAYRKKEVQAECRITDSKPIEILPEEMKGSEGEKIKAASIEAEQIGKKVIRVHFVEYVGKRKKKVTHIEVTNAELDAMLKNPENKAFAQLAMF